MPYSKVDEDNFNKALSNLQYLMNHDNNKLIEMTKQHIKSMDLACYHLNVSCPYKKMIKHLLKCLGITHIPKNPTQVEILPTIYQTSSQVKLHNQKTQGFLQALKIDSKNLQKELSLKIIGELNLFIKEIQELTGLQTPEEWQAKHSSAYMSIIYDNEIQNFTNDIEAELLEANLDRTNVLYADALKKISNTTQILQDNFKQIAEDNFNIATQYSDDTAQAITAKLRININKAIEANNAIAMRRCAIYSHNAIGVIIRRSNPPTTTISAVTAAQSPTKDRE